MLNWANRFNIFCLLDHAGYGYAEPEFDVRLAAGSVASFRSDGVSLFASLRSFHEQHPGWLFGHLAYPQDSSYTVVRKGRIEYEPAFFFSPRYVIDLKDTRLWIHTADDIPPAVIFEEISQSSPEVPPYHQSPLEISQTLSRDSYRDIIHQLQQHIRRGDCYEINFCQEYYAGAVILDPVALYHRLRQVSPNPFNALYRIEDRYCLCASPERFLQMTGKRIISQPIKGTSRRRPDHPGEDEKAKLYLRSSEKERAENVMVVDLVRNDLSRIAAEGSVKVPELFGVYAFPQVYQMISTVEAKKRDGVHWTDVLEACFPMGSMTGAPKKRVMELINQYESEPRGLFSGTIGYVDPHGNMDCNVVIRSLFYDDASRIVSFKTGSGITAYCDADAEFDECNLKAEAIQQLLRGD